ncbi:SixA phosphatase family protein, partial [Streptomyces sp. NPDC000851]
MITRAGSGPLRRLVVLRHAKSAWPLDVADHERPLAPRGRRDAPAAGRALAEADCLPDLALCSTAARARQTWDPAAVHRPHGLLRGRPVAGRRLRLRRLARPAG